MHLKEVRMENFKSFGHSLAVPLKKGFTAVTGPNGAGKSNIADAILFVLGPSSTRMIRAQKLTDLIFNGGKNEKGAKECEVSLVFDNSDHVMPIEADEVVLTRRIRKAPKRGQPDNYYSYFYVNGRAAKLREFTELLQHARISADGYNIVTQGAVTQMVEMTNVERRQVLDSIAGITEFDSDIEKAEKKRGEVEQNLEHVNIILNEIRADLETLRKERDAALEYGELKTRHDGLKSVFAFRRKEEIERQIADVHEDIGSKKTQRDEHAAKLEEVRVKLKDAHKQKQELETKLAELGGPEGEKTRKEIEELQAEGVRAEERLNYARDEVKDYSEDKRVLGQEQAKVDKELERLRQEAQSLEEDLAEWTKTLESKEKEFKEVRESIAQSDQGSLQVNQELARLKADYEETSTALHQQRLALDRYEEKRNATEERVAELEDAKSTYEFEIKDIDFQVEGLKDQVKESGASVKATEKELMDKRKRQATITEDLNDLETAVRRLQNQYHELKAREEASANAGQGLTRAVDGVLEARGKGRLKGIHGTVADLGKPKEKKYETALEVAAGSRMLSVIVEDDGAAAAAIDFLKENRLGRAQFLPLNKLSGTKPRGKALMAVKDDAALGFAVDLIEYDERFAEAFSLVFGDTVVVKDLTNARRLMGGVRLVTLDGELLESSGAMVGGSMDRRRSVKFAGKDVSKLADVEAELQKAVEAQERLTDELVEVRKRITELEEALSHGRAQETVEIRIKDHATRRKEFEAKLETITKELDAKRQELTGLEDAIAKTEAKVAEMSSHMEELEAARKDKSKILLKGAKKDLADRAAQLDHDLEEARTKKLEANSALETVRSQIGLVGERAAEIEARIKQVEAEVEKNKKDAEAAKKKIEEVDERLKVLTKAQSQLTGKEKELRDARDKAVEAIHTLNSKSDMLLNKIDTIESLVVTAENKLPTLEETLGEVLMELKDLGADEPPEDAPSLADCKQEIQALESQMRRLEPVNMLAVEEYEKKHGREGELVDEVERLNEQRENLIKVVEEIVTKKKAGLMEVFEAVNENIKAVYSRLMDGGEAFIELENPERPFEGGLILKARPRGKKVARLQALSGGEKSMAALAFIFAIQEYEPSPFYVLDEVDMFLDGVNSELVAEMVKENSTRAQFIMISLRKVTLKEADHIYGVTMAGDGVSQMIANFDITQITEEGELVREAGDGATLQVEKAAGKGGDDGDEGEDGRSIGDTVKDMMKVEVGK